MRCTSVDDFRLLRKFRTIPKRERAKIKRTVRKFTMLALEESSGNNPKLAMRVYLKHWHWSAFKERTGSIRANG